MCIPSSNKTFLLTFYSQAEASYEPRVAYAQSNAARVMFVKKLAKQVSGKGTRAFSVDPGGMFSSRLLYRFSSFSQ